MKLGLGLYRHMLTRENFSFARQAGATHVVAHLVDYFPARTASAHYARGGAMSVGMEGPYDAPMPKGMVWNMVYDANAPKENTPSITPDELWQRFGEFLDATVPVAEEAGVKLALHPDDPPMPTMRGQPRLVYQPELYQRVIDRRPSSANLLEFCLGSLAEMVPQSRTDIYQAVDQYS